MILTTVLASLLLIPRTGDPSAQPAERVYEGRDACELPCAFFGGEGVTGVTYTAWVKWYCGWGSEGQMSGMPPLVATSVSYQSARTKQEGGHGPTNLLDDAYLADGLPLSAGGTWSASVLTPTGDLAPSSLDGMNWKYGCFVVNYSSDAAFTVNVGGTERYCEASPTNVWFNIIASSASRTVSVAAESASALIKFGIGHNPLVQFIGGQSDGTRLGTTTVDTACGGIASNEWRMIVFRARISGGSVTTLTEMWRPTSKCTTTETVTQAMWRPAQYFAEDSRCRISCGHIGGMTNSNKVHGVHWYAPKGRAYWMTDEEVELWRDLDLIEINRRGMR